MVRVAIIFVMLSVIISPIAQTDYIRPGLIKATATISPSNMLNRSVQNIYLSGFLEVHPQKNISFRGDINWFIDGHSRNDMSNEFFQEGMRLYFGSFYHFNKNNWDNYIGLEPGIALFKPLSSVDPTAKLQASPSFAVHVGSTYFVWKIFNFYIDLAYVNSSFRGLDNGSQRTDELILSAGLGFHVNTKKQ